MQNNRQLKGEAAVERYNEIKEKGGILFECIVGSQSYGTNLATSDVDKKFVYIDTLDSILSGNSTEQLSITDDYVGYEIGRFIELLSKQNPNIIEILYADDKFIEHCDPSFKDVLVANRDKFLSRRVANSFGDYAASQIGKAQGTNKKFMNPMEKERKTLLDFCWVASGQGSIPLKKFMNDLLSDFDFKNKIGLHLNMEYIPNWVFGCVAIDHMKDYYHLFVDTESLKKFWTTDDELLRDVVFAHRKYNGVVDKDGVQVKLASVDKGEEPVCTFHCNIDGFSVYCKLYKEYWEWMEKRNEQRFVENASNENNYDRKNMMHCHRLLDMCAEILNGEGVKVFRPNREELLEIRHGNRTYQELVDWAIEKKEKIHEIMQTSPLPNEISKDMARDVLLQLRKSFYKLK